MKIHQLALTIILSLGLGSAEAGLFTQDKSVWIGIQPFVLKSLSNGHKKVFDFQDSIKGDEETYFKIKESEMDKLSEFIHHSFKRCGGFRVLSGKPSNKEVQISSFKAVTTRTNAIYDFQTLLIPDYSINQESLVNSWFPEISQDYMTSVILHLSSYKNRYYKSIEGVAALHWIGEEWSRLTQSRSDAKVEYYQHTNFPQPSVILTIEGSDPLLKKQVIILGGHGDSINSQNQNVDSAAPGADDNAAGIAVLSNIIKILVEQNYQPKHTIQFIAYAAEEVGLQGSAELAVMYRQKEIPVLGVIQFDGVNYAGKSYDMILYADETSAEQNQFVASLLDTYVKINWTWDKCNYWCSDHAWWNNQGYRASFPAEALFSEENPYIHTPEDTIDKSNKGTEHAVLFMKLGIAYLIELDQ